MASDPNLGRMNGAPNEDRAMFLLVKVLTLVAVATVDKKTR